MGGFGLGLRLSMNSGFSGEPSITIPQSVPLTLNGSGLTLTDDRTATGQYLIANGASNTPTRSVSNLAPFTGDALIEVTPLDNPMGYIGLGFHASAISSTTASVADPATARETIALEGNGGGDLYIAIFKNGASATPASVNRLAGELIFLELVGAAFIISTGTSFAARTAKYSGTRVDAAARYFAATDFIGPTSLNKSWRVRVRAHPGG